MRTLLDASRIVLSVGARFSVRLTRCRLDGSHRHGPKGTLRECATRRSLKLAAHRDGRPLLHSGSSRLVLKTFSDHTLLVATPCRNGSGNAVWTVPCGNTSTGLTCGTAIV